MLGGRHATICVVCVGFMLIFRVRLSRRLDDVINATGLGRLYTIMKSEPSVGMRYVTTWGRLERLV